MKTDKTKCKLTLAAKLRSTAEDQLKFNKQVNGNSIETPDITSILHELQVHQIELEMQNEELRRTNAELLQSEYLNRSILQSLPSSIAVLDMHGYIISVNDAWSDFALSCDVNYPVVGTNYLDIYRRSLLKDHPSSQASVGIESVLNGIQKYFSIEYECHRPAQQRWFIITVVPLGSQGRNGAIISHFDITKRKHDEITLKNSEERYRQLFELDAYAVLMINLDTNRIMDANCTALQMYGYSKDDIMQLSPVDLSAEPTETEAFIRNREFRSNLLWHRSKDGKVFPVEITGNYFQYLGCEVHVASIRDITDSRHTKKLLSDLNQKLSDMNEHLLTVQEQERITIARDIHDDLGQNLTLLKLDLEFIQLRIPTGDADLNQTVISMRTSIDQIICKIQQIAADLRPPLLDDLGLTAAIGWQVDKIKKRSAIEFFLMLDEESDSLDQKTATTVMRIVQEGLTNIVRHANANEVYISLCKREKTLFLEISDNGCGITSEQLASSKSYGLMGMRERARSCRGTLEIVSGSASNTTLSLSIPLDIGEDVVWKEYCSLMTTPFSDRVQ